MLAEFREAMDDDLDTPRATALLFDTVRRANAALDAGSPDAAALAAAAHVIASTVRSPAGGRGAISTPTPPIVLERSTPRAPPRTSPLADALRAELQADGWTVETTREGTSLRR